ESRRRPVQLYDFKHPERISKEQLRTLRTIHDNLARILATYLSTTLRTLVDVNFSTIDQVTYNEYSLSLSVPTSLYILALQKMEGKAILEISPQFLLFVVDRLLGGLGNTEIEAREITHIEQNVVKRIILAIVEYLNEVWSQVHEIGALLEGFETDPQFVQIARSSEAISIIFFEIRVRGVTYTMNLGLPYYVLEPILNKLSTQSMLAITGRRPQEDKSDVIRDRLRISRLPINARLAETTVTVRDFVNLGTDDLLQLEKRTRSPIEVLVGGKVKFYGTPGKSGRRRAVQILRQIRPEEELIYE
ncbi:MAG: flagellar motor switch protein FliM, partial [Calditrichota bacterium]